MGKIEYNLNGLDLNRQFVYINNNVPRLSPEVINNMKPRLSQETMDAIKSQQTTLWRNQQQNNMYRQIGAYGVNQLSGQLSNTLSNNIFGNDTLTGQAFGQIFSSGINSASDTLSNNILKGQALSDGLLQNTGASVAGTAAGVTGNLIGRGINDLGGDSMLSRGIGQGIASGIGTFGGAALSNIIKGKNAFQGFRAVKDGALATKEALAAGKTAKEAADIGKAASAASKANLVSAGMSIAGSALGAAFGPSKEYNGKYGSITRGMDTAYDIVQGTAGLFGPVGMTVSGIMALNKGLSNVFGSTSGMTRQDAILGSAFMPAPVKWLNMAGAKTTDKFSNQSWQNQEKSTSFMQDAFGDLQDKFDKAREEAGKTYGTFSRHAYNKAQGNVEFANRAWGQIMDMADQNELQNIRSQYMTSINNQRYAQDIMGGWNPMYRGKLGMKILNNATNHNIGMRLLSGAALIDDKQMILCNVQD